VLICFVVSLRAWSSCAEELVEGFDVDIVVYPVLVTDGRFSPGEVPVINK
jgi:hypothetical protein